MDRNRPRLEVVESPDGWLVAGELDAATSTSLTDAFAENPGAAGRLIQLDFAEVEFVDSTGLRVLLALAERASAMGGGVVIRNPSRMVTRLLAMTQLESTFGLEVNDRPRTGNPGDLGSTASEVE